jgi:hypothetical protein
LLQDIARANLQDRFAEAMERIKQIFTEIAAGPMIKLISGFAKLLENTTLLKVLAYGLVGLFGAIATSVAIATGGAAVLGAAAAIAATSGLMAYGSYSSGGEDMKLAPQNPTPQTPSQAPSTLSDADMASRISQTKVDDAAIAPSPNNLIQTPGGNVKPNKNDSILLSTNPGGINNDNVVKKLDEMNNYLKQPKEIKNVVELNDSRLIKKVDELIVSSKKSQEVKELVYIA